MKGISSIPRTSTVQHERPWRDGSRTVKVPLWTPSPKGRVEEGWVQVPRRLSRAEEHTNKRLEFLKLMEWAVARWAGYREKLGWYISTKPVIGGPFDIPDHGTSKQQEFIDRAEAVIGKSPVSQPVIFEKDEEICIYVLRARFKREQPLYVGLDDFVYINDKRETFGIPSEDYLPENDVTGDRDSGWVDPMKEAEESRRAKGIKREDYLLGDLSEPL